MDDIKTLEHATLKVPYEILNKKFRLAQKVIDREVSSIKCLLSDLDNLISCPNKNFEVELKNILEKMKQFREKTKSSIDDEIFAAKSCKRRLDHLEEHNHNGKDNDEWRKKRLDRMLVEYFLRAGYYDSAIELAKVGSIEGLTNMELFLTSRKVEDDLSSKNTNLCIAWCQDNKSKLKRMKSSLELNVRQQEFIELVKEKNVLEAVKHARQYLSSACSEKMINVQQCMGLLAFDPQTNVQPYKNLFSNDRWKDLIQQFRAENFKLYQLNNNSIFSVTMQCGLSALKTRHCFVENEKTDACPVCERTISTLAETLPFSHCSHSRLICRLSGEPLNEHNPPMVLPNGYVYGYNALFSMASKNNGKVQCPKTKDMYDITEAEKLLVIFCVHHRAYFITSCE